jgi:hypothetical protein
MTFSIRVLNEPVETVYDENCHWCWIDINDYSERFPAPLTVWNIDQYKQQWERAIARILKGEAITYLITGLRDPWNSDFISLFVLYREGDDVFIQNQIILCEGNEDKIAKMDLLDLVEERETHTEEGEEISEWKVPIDELRFFVVSA